MLVLKFYVIIGSPRMSRKRKARTKKRQPSNNNDRSPNQNSDSTENNEELAYLDTLPEVCLKIYIDLQIIMYDLLIFSMSNWWKSRQISGELSSKFTVWQKHFQLILAKLLTKPRYFICNHAK